MSAAMELVPLVCLFVAAWSGITSADGRPAVQLVKDNEDVVLECSLGESAQGKIFSWTKDTEEVITITPPTRIDIGQDFRGRVSHFPDALQSGNASIVIRGTKVSDSGRYICEFPNDPPETRANISLTVGPPVVQMWVEEDGEAVLNCSLGKDAQGKIFSWTKDTKEVITINRPPTSPQIEPLFQDRVSHFPEALQSGNASIRISRAKVSDSGSYICEFPNENPEIRSIISLTVGNLTDRSKGSGSSNGGWIAFFVLLVIFAFCGIAVAVYIRRQNQCIGLRSRSFPPAPPVNGRDPNTDTMLEPFPVHTEEGNVTTHEPH